MRVVGLVASATVLATTPVAQAVVAQVSSVADEDSRTVCKQRPRTGTRFAVRTCRTVREWAELEEAHRRQGAEMLSRPTIATQSNRPDENISPRPPGG